jgi:RNA polymerase sigma-B factor
MVTDHRDVGKKSRPPLEDLDALALDYVARVQAPDSARADLREEMTARCLPFAGRLARRYAGHGEPLADLEQVASLGLIKAIDRYDPARGSFTAYALTTVTGELKRHFRDKTWGVHVTRRLQELGREARATSAAMTAKAARTPTVEEIAEQLSAAPAEVREAMASLAGYRPASLNRTVHADDRMTELGDLVGAADPDLESLDDRLTVTGLVRRLPEREQRLVALRFYGNRTQAEIAAELGISQMHVSRLLSRTLAWLREALLGDTLPVWEVTSGHRAGPGLVVVMSSTPKTLTLHLRGEIDRDATGCFRARVGNAIRHGGRAHVVLDLTEVPLVDASGIGALADAATEAGRAGVALEITGAQPYVAPLLAVCGLDPRRPA